MTQNQLKYWADKEVKRHNLAMEDLQSQTLRESTRHNLSVEGETNRSNEAQERLKDAQNAIAMFSAQSSDYIGRFNAVEGRRHNLYAEQETQRHNERTETETQRHNERSEQIDFLGQGTSNKNSERQQSTELTKLSETIRNNKFNNYLGVAHAATEALKAASGSGGGLAAIANLIGG